MGDKVSWGVGQSLGYAVEFLEKGKYPICQPAVDHFEPQFRAKAIRAAQECGLDAAALEAAVTDIAFDTAKDALLWAVENHPWKNRSHEAVKHLAALVNEDVILTGVDGGQSWL
ncbi:MAG: hypothetical protein LBD37_03465 [Treponema sp.]|jgi:hypothetical protein|nr:hypothetical protein [Treponema sp.]